MDSSEKMSKSSSGEEKDSADHVPAYPRSVDAEVRRPSYLPGNESSALGILQQIDLQDQHHPLRWPVWKKWIIITIYCLLQVFVTITSTSYVSAESLIMEKFNVNSIQVVTLGQSLFIVGNAIGPAFLGPLS